MASVFKQSTVVTTQRTPLEIVRDTLDVDAEGTVRFHCRVGRGSGKAFEIPSDQFNEFVNLMIEARNNHERLTDEDCTTSTTSDTETLTE
jgi:hypothetical protein